MNSEVVWWRVITSDPVDRLARIVTSPAPGWAPGCFSREQLSYIPDRMTGKVSGRLTVLGRRAFSSETNGWSLVCRCYCGNHVLARHRHIRHRSVCLCAECEAVASRVR